MTDDLRTNDPRLDSTIDALRRTPAISRDAVALVAARAVVANAPAARATRWSLRAVAVLALVAIGTRLVPQRSNSTAGVASVASESVAPLTSTAGTPLRQVARTDARTIVFELDADAARSVQVLGDFNGWSRDASQMLRGSDGVWRLTTSLPPGRYVYAYLVDGQRFVADPARDPVEDRDFGVTGSELVVGVAP